MPSRLRTGLRAILLASLGGCLEFYDFVIFVFFAVAIGKEFFPASLPEWVRQLVTFGIFAAGYLSRPIGGIVMAHFGDTRGRKTIFVFSVLLMAIPTLLIGLLPTYGSIGVAAPLLLLLLRVIQGIAVGGEVPGGWVFVAEHAAPGRTGFTLGLLTGGLCGGILLGSLVAAVISLTSSPAQIADGMWRVPFLIGGVLGFVSMALRRWLKETPVFESLRSREALSRELPLRVVLKEHRDAVVASVLCTWTLTAGIVVVILMTPALLQTLFNMPQGVTQAANMVATAALVLSTVIVGALTDRFGVRRLAAPAMLFMMMSTYALYLGASRMPSALILLYGLAGAGAGAVVLVPIAMIRAFPPAVRFSAISFSYNIAYAVFGGLTPIVVSWLAHFNSINPAHYLSVATLSGLLAILFGPFARVNESRTD